MAQQKANVLDIYTIIFLALAVFVFIRLRSVLGQRTGRERPPYDPYSAADKAKPVAATNKVISLADQRDGPSPAHAAPADDTPATERFAGIAEPGTPLAASLDAVVKAQPDFDAKHFLTGAKAAYEMIVTAFAEGDRKTLKNLLAKDVFDGFAHEIGEREKRGETLETRFVAIEKTDLTAAEVKANTAQITVRFVSQLVSMTKNKAGEAVEGSPNGLTDVTDVWTFARDIGARDPNWKLVATESV